MTTSTVMIGGAEILLYHLQCNREALYFLMIAFPLMIYYSAFIFGGLQGFVYPAFFSVVILGTLLLGIKGLIMTTGVTSVVLISLFFSETAKLITPIESNIVEYLFAQYLILMDLIQMMRAMTMKHEEW